ncbi:hypothetical protein AB0H12_33750 [Actinosynnema sp. NPDC023794]
MAENSSVAARKAIDFIQTSGLVNVDVPLKDVFRDVGKLEEVAGYVAVWEKYAVVVASEAEQVVKSPVI